MKRILNYQQAALDVLNSGGHLSEDEAARQPFDLQTEGGDTLAIHPDTVKWLFKNYKFTRQTMCVQSNGYAMNRYFIKPQPQP